MLIEPREADWKKVVAHWLPCPAGHLLSTLTSLDRKNILASIPPKATFFRSALSNFWKLKISMDLDSVQAKVKEHDFYRAIPLFRNKFFRLRTRLLPLWTRLHFDTIGSILNPSTGLPLTRAELKDKVSEEDPTIPRSRIHALASILQRYQSRIPASLTSLLTLTRNYSSGEIVRYIDDVSEEHYAIIRGQRWL